ncbi:UV radiation resistance-associated gene protein [Toxorhynchites rutilus septentrionalis]|uniref:UV radiation resistance-associated gene protein n=1 Tax=Toxorhynchites rutilus septentrionalis TaxID=329112 RepID=UPI002479480B|nr:UV radiation resistance-associated gene protein [Toxorhynchites rutilus septentrionalis]XP_055637527.1 UV radiation resistance-associated gene protein [Toxorhynchites rutilus septentrionalis]XP_055637528.1 UV radiation resistance-associated gene protein [Toxorhynchites rutilus septentrionalis]XP_055637529.1 UV radiation resistance-associated gene protein [Toxorhynchites rutilus septentrionalis]
MFDRPRCRDWSPLSTQQLRLRSLIQISGHNIRCDYPKCSVYFTLHTTTMSAPFYTSEKMDIHTNIIWPEINCPMMVKSSMRCVCIRVWQQTASASDGLLTKTDGPVGGAGAGDKQLFFWGVYFSGLVPLSRRSEKRLKENTLVFQMHGGFFTSADYILEHDERKAQFSVPQSKTPNADSDSPKISLLSENKDLLCDNSNNRPPSWYSSNSLLNVESKTSKHVNDGSSVSTSFNLLDFDGRSSVRTTASPTPTEAETNLKIRYLFMEFFKSEVRPSYDVKRLLAIQERQRRIKYESESAKELTDRICMKSVYCLNLELFSDKRLVYRSAASSHQNRGGMGRQLSRLLYQEQEPLKPEMLLKAQDLRRRIELARFRCRILVQEKERVKGCIRQLRQKLNHITDINIESESTLMAQYRNYGKEKEGLYQQKLAYASEKESYRDLKAKVLVARHRVLRGLNEIYCIQKNNNGTCTINDITLPNAESYTDATPALALSVALGYVAHTVMMCSSILNIPLRNPIKYEGSRSKMIDCVKVLPTTDREFPLYCRSGPPTNALLYAVFLLNQNISQIKYYLCLSRGDPRATLSNLHDILNVPSINVLNRDVEDPFQAIQTAMSGSSSVDLNVPIAFNQLTITNLRPSKSASRISRSVDNYAETTDGKRKGKFASDPILAQGQLQVTGFDKNKNF